jgi:DNA-binding CsgD family transcriptional regulator
MMVDYSHNPKQSSNIKLFEFGDDKKNIIQTFSDWFGVDYSLLVSPSRKKELVDIRDLVVFILREYAGMSYQAIGRLLGGRDHTTIMHAYNKVKNSGNNLTEFETTFKDLISQSISIKNRKDIAEEALNSYIADIKIQSSTFAKKRRLTDKEEKILELYREGLTLEEISTSFSLTRERIRQIVEKTIRQIAANESIDKGITMNADVLLEEEKKIRHKKRYPEKPKPEVKLKRWSRYHISCNKCGTTTVPHFKKGLCENCGGKSLYGEKRDSIMESHKSECDKCQLTRKESFIKYGRDLYITDENKTVLCRGCFQSRQAKELGSYKHFEWSRYYPECVSCGTTSIAHQAKGLCKTCSPERTQEDRDEKARKLGDKCNQCGMTKAESYEKTGRNLYLNKENELLCRSCFFKVRHMNKILTDRS